MRKKRWKKCARVITVVNNVLAAHFNGVLEFSSFDSQLNLCVIYNLRIVQMKISTQIINS